MSRLVAVAVTAAILVPAFAQPDKPKALTPVAPDPFADMVQKLHYQRVAIDYVPKGKTLREVRDDFEKMLGVKVVVDEQQFLVYGPDFEGLLDKKSSCELNLKGMPLIEAIRRAALDFRGTLYISEQHVEIAPKYMEEGQFDDLPEDSEQRGSIVAQMPLVSGVFKDTPMAEAMDELARLNDRTVVVSNRAEKQSKTNVSARLKNVPFDTAIYTLAAMNGLEVARRGNVYMISTPEHIKSLRAVNWK